MPYSNVTNPMMQPPSNNNWWFGNNYSNGYSQANRGLMQAPPIYPQPYSPASQMQQEPQTMNNIIQAMGPESAEEFRIGPNSHIAIFDSNRPVFYKKDSDDTGHAMTRAFEYYEIPLHPQQAQQSSTQQLTKEDVVEIIKSTIGPWQKSIEELVMNND